MLIDQILGVEVLFGVFFVNGVSYKNVPHGDKFNKLLFPDSIYWNYAAHTCNAVLSIINENLRLTVDILFLSCYWKQ